MIDYSILYKTALPIKSKWPKHEEWDLFISGFNSSERVQRVFDKAKAKNKHWLIFREYGYKRSDFPEGTVFAFNSNREAYVISDYLARSNLDLAGLRVCVDITGFIQPYLMSLISIFVQRQVKSLDAIYSEPWQYVKRERTKFSDELAYSVRQVAGYEGSHTPEANNDLLIIGAGYDHELIARVASNKDNARKIQILGLPSLWPEMYQENVLRAQLVSEAMRCDVSDEQTCQFASAADPFATASTLSRIVSIAKERHRVSNIYLSPLSTKSQVLGFALYYLNECQGEPASIIYPFCHSYPRETSKGLSGIWKYEIPISLLAPRSVA